MASAFQPESRRAPVLGLVRNIGPESIDARAWVTAHNVVIRKGAVEKVRGWARRDATFMVPLDGSTPGTWISAICGTPTMILPARLGSAVLHNLILTTQNIFRLNDAGTGWVSLLGQELGGTAAARWQADYELGNWYFTNQLDGLLRYDGVTLAKVNTGDPIITAAYIAQFVHHLILARLQGGGNDPAAEHSYLGSGLAKREMPIPDWDTENVASDALMDSIPDDATAFTGIRRIAGGLALYKETAIYIANYVGLPNVYSIEPRVSGHGLMAPYSLTDNGRAHVFVGQDNLYTFNGSAPQAVGDRVWAWLKEQTTDLARTQIWTFHDPRFKEVYFAYNGTSALVWNYEYDVFTTRDLPFTAMGFLALTNRVKTFDELTEPMDEIGVLQPSINLEGFDVIGADVDGFLYQLDEETDTTTDSGWVTATLQSGTTSSLNVRTCGGILLDVSELTGSQPLQVFVSGRMSLGDPLNWKGPFLYKGGGRISCMVTGFHHDFKFVKTGGRFVLRGYAPLFQDRGER